MASHDGSARDAPGGRVAIVLPGGGARGAYEVGALSVLLPELERRGEKPTIFCGTSVGAINAAYLGSVAHEAASDQVHRGLEHWRALSKGDIIRTVVGPGLPRTLLRFAGDVLEVPGCAWPACSTPRRCAARSTGSSTGRAWSATVATAATTPSA